MIQIRKANDRGHADHGWLDSWHTFSFADYYDPQHAGFRSLRVINDDRVAGGGGFGTHPHRDMEIISYVLSGALQHRDSMGNTAVMRAGEVQKITAGTGIAHSEFNFSPVEPVHFLQIWLFPERKGLTPEYEQTSFAQIAYGSKLLTLAAPQANGSGVRLHQDATILLGKLKSGAKVNHAIAPGRHAWVQVAEGTVTLNGHTLNEGDGAALSDESAVELEAGSQAQVLVFDLA